MKPKQRESMKDELIKEFSKRFVTSKLNNGEYIAWGARDEIIDWLEEALDRYGQAVREEAKREGYIQGAYDQAHGKYDYDYPKKENK